uniref:Uncharacterized protein n=1 Tax=Nothoprocta perdicaria TaxID=30464 RepID=A0A8C7EG21_NOTPE
MFSDAIAINTTDTEENFTEENCSLGSNRKYLNHLSQHLRSTQKTTIPHLQLKLKMLRQQTCVCLLFFPIFLCYLVTMILKPQVFKRL